MNAVAESEREAGVTAMLDTLLGSSGSCAHPYVRSPELLSGPDAARNLADAVHYLCVLHGRLPSVIDLAAAKAGTLSSHPWLDEAARGFALERTYLTRLVVTVGPLPSTPGQSECEAAVVSQHHALEMLARSERTGCALGAAIGLTLDWAAVRPMLDVAADRFGLERMTCLLPATRDTYAFASAVATTAGIERAVRFGVEQILLQHGGLWSLLESREHARRG
ncbi:MAG: hypothetical protein JWM38_416 [Sphingomonas bacterium]|jgi:hypothetical protein|nr:hypothetical protein [Sphingomonas bacterium]MDB5685399.1 hypothetical protein [Sphingomonas bacterium]MDB5716989.1 hypothetical protein [Sphingomonas bacterium]